jgi:hypothetical protein
MLTWSNGSIKGSIKIEGTPTAVYDNANSFSAMIPKGQSTLSLYLNYQKGAEATLDIKVGVFVNSGEIFWLTYTTGAVNVFEREFHFATSCRDRLDVGLNAGEKRIFVCVKGTDGGGGVTGTYTLMADCSVARFES